MCVLRQFFVPEGAELRKCRLWEPFSECQKKKVSPNGVSLAQMPPMTGIFRIQVSRKLGGICFKLLSL